MHGQHHCLHIGDETVLVQQLIDRDDDEKDRMLIDLLKRCRRMTNETWRQQKIENRLCLSANRFGLDEQLDTTMLPSHLQVINIQVFEKKERDFTFLFKSFDLSGNFYDENDVHRITDRCQQLQSLSLSFNEIYRWTFDPHWLIIN
jgi:hypothetical protein